MHYYGNQQEKLCWRLIASGGGNNHHCWKIFSWKNKQNLWMWFLVDIIVLANGVLIFFMKFVCWQDYQVLAPDIKSLIICAVITLETSLEVSILAIFWGFLHIIILAEKSIPNTNLQTKSFHNTVRFYWSNHFVLTMCLNWKYLEHNDINRLSS